MTDTLTNVLAYHGISNTFVSANGHVFIGDVTAIDNAREAGIIQACLECGSVMAIEGTELQRVQSRETYLDMGIVGSCCGISAVIL